MVCGAFCVSYGVVFRKRSQALWIHWSFLVWIRYVNGLMNRHQLFECDSCQALHLPHMQNFDGIFDAKIDLINDVVLFSALAEVKPSALLALAADLSASTPVL
jgi:GDP-D-mannose dehydratase